MTTSLMPTWLLACDLLRSYGQLTWILCVFRAHIVVAGVEDIFVHERRAGCDLSEEGDFDGLADLDTLTLLDKDLSGVFAPIFAVERGHTVLLGVVTFLEGL